MTDRIITVTRQTKLTIEELASLHPNGIKGVQEYIKANLVNDLLIHNKDELIEDKQITHPKGLIRS